MASQKRYLKRLAISYPCKFDMLGTLTLTDEKVKYSRGTPKQILREDGK